MALLGRAPFELRALPRVHQPTWTWCSSCPQTAGQEELQALSWDLVSGHTRGWKLYWEAVWRTSPQLLNGLADTVEYGGLLVS